MKEVVRQTATFYIPRCRGVFPSTSFKFGLAPRSNKILTDKIKVVVIICYNQFYIL